MVGSSNELSREICRTVRRGWVPSKERESGALQDDSPRPEKQRRGFSGTNQTTNDSPNEAGR